MPRSPRKTDHARTERPARRGRGPGEAPFSSFLERDALREKRRKSRRRTLLISVAVHAAALVAVLIYSLWHVDELFGPSVKVTVFKPGQLPPGVVVPAPAPAPPAAPPAAASAAAPKP